jgi:tetratricopeptide (TPR) repeat protein
MGRNIFLKKFGIGTALFYSLTFLNIAHAQLTILPDGGNKRAFISEQIGLTNVSIQFNRPAVKNREGHIWGELIPVGYFDQGFGPSKSSPWRAGANENTTIEFSTDVKVEGQPLAAGKYGFFIAYGPNESTLIFSKNSTSWGSFYYDPSEDALRVKVKPVAIDKSIEWLSYQFSDETLSSAIVRLTWEKLVIPVKIEVDLIQTQLSSFRKELRSEKGFIWENWNQAALYCAEHKVNLSEALLWTDTATSENNNGRHSFQAWRTKAIVLDSLGRTDEASEAMKSALPWGDVLELYLYGKLLAKQKKGKEAFEVFKMGNERSPDDFIANLGMARGYSALGEYKKALTFAKRAQIQAVGETNKNLTNKMAKYLTEGKDIN